MLVVLAVLALAIGMVASRRPGVSQGVQLQGRASQLAGTLRAARGQAIAGNRVVPVVVAPDGTRLMIGGVPDVSGSFPLRILRPDGVPMLGFLPDGSTTGGAIEVTAGEARLTVAVARRSGRVVVQHAP